MTGFIPIFGAFIAAGGNVASGTAYQVCVLFLTESIMQLLHGILFPILQMSAALGITDAVNPTLRLSGFVSGLRTAVTWILGFIMTMFSALLSVRSIVASAADSLASRSVRLLASGLIPIVGNAVSDAYGTVQGSIRLLRNGVGAVGILVILWLVLPPLISLCIYRMIFHINSIFAEMAGAKPLAQLFRNTQAVLSAAFAVLVCFAVMMIVSSAAVLLLIGN
jgi:stage III sporulation protein AE